MQRAAADAALEGSDYGSDFGDDGDSELSLLLEEIELRERAASYVHVPATSGSQHAPRPGASLFPEPQRPGAAEVEVQYDAHSSPAAQDDSAGTIRFESAEPEDNPADTRSPLQRFRMPPKKPLSVTDLVSPAWCELQYLYSLTKYGRVKRTPAMKQGSAVHQALEEQVHQTVKVDVRTPEDHWGVRMWNVIQGLRTLRVTGMTRELEIWGVIDGQVVNGVVDELSFTCPDPGLEAALEKVERTQTQHKSPPPNQHTISHFFGASGGSSFANAARDAAAQQAGRPRLVYITDVKTRGSQYLPKGTSLRPTYMQLMLYRKLLSSLASGSVDAQAIFQRYNLNSTDRLSDSLLAQLSSLDFNFSPDSTQDTFALVESPVDAVVELLTHNSLTQLWQLMMEEFQKTFTQGANSVSKVLRAEFRSSHDGSVLGEKIFAYNEHELEPYVQDEMSWWRGEREARGVDVEEAFKCRSCAFAEGCSWRLTKIESAIQKARARAAAQTESSV